MRIFILFSVILLSCGKTKVDFLASDNLMGNHREIVLQKLDSLGALELIDEEEFVYQYNFSPENRPAAAYLKLNEDCFESDSILKFTLYIGADSVSFFKDKYMQSYGKGIVSQGRLEEIKQFFISVHGQPDSICHSKTWEVEHFFDGKPQVYESKKDTSVNYQRIYKWNLKESDLFLKCKPIINEDYELSGYSGFETLVEYRAVNYSAQLNKIKENLRKNLKPADIIKFTPEFVEWKETRSENYGSYKEFGLTFTIVDIFRTSKLEDRPISKIKYDLVVMDEFNDVLCVFDNCVYNPTVPIKITPEGYTISSKYFDSFTMNYSTLTDGFKANNYAFHYARKNGVKLSARIKSVIFSDGSTMNS
ncbi:hypothetical protein [Luteibaculum oceani]|uniref:Uncharacterized protein n=1 Tax=Luteibaculum oceani TaxID=1294296 RepID=A0A5C6UZA9_9FLAO|nr:hypothetical protein [Luteibaculum oceani]TXC78773.1 hypothetical protein FRX97_06030 [Luteibaculum oceani]